MIATQLEGPTDHKFKIGDHVNHGGLGQLEIAGYSTLSGKLSYKVTHIGETKVIHEGAWEHLMTLIESAPAESQTSPNHNYKIGTLVWHVNFKNVSEITGYNTEGITGTYFTKNVETGEEYDFMCDEFITDEIPEGKGKKTAPKYSEGDVITHKNIGHVIIDEFKDGEYHGFGKYDKKPYSFPEDEIEHLWKAADTKTVELQKLKDERDNIITELKKKGMDLDEVIAKIMVLESSASS